MTLTRFKDLKIGDTFDFINPNGMSSFYEPCRKVDSTKYVAMNDDGQDNTRYGVIRVGSANCHVYHVGRKAGA